MNQAVAIPGTNVAVRVLDNGDNGKVEQTNSNRSGDAVAINRNGTTQSNGQAQSGTGGNATSGDARGGNGGNGGNASSGKAAGGDVNQSQNASNSNGTSQNANAVSKAWQLFPSNEVRGNNEKGVMAR